MDSGFAFFFFFFFFILDIDVIRRVEVVVYCLKLECLLELDVGFVLRRMARKYNQKYINWPYICSTRKRINGTYRFELNPILSTQTCSLDQRRRVQNPRLPLRHRNRNLPTAINSHTSTSDDFHQLITSVESRIRKRKGIRASTLTQVREDCDCLRAAVAFAHS
jgi:hypothetical protein